MKSTAEKLGQRGLLPLGEEKAQLYLNYSQMLALLQSDHPKDRTLGARLLSLNKDKECIDPLIEALKIEKKLYSKLEICQSLASFGGLATSKLIRLLGTIGTNQHKVVEFKQFKKKSYPLPRDIVARILIRIGHSALFCLIETLNGEDKSKLSEAIDAIGYINFYNPNPNCFQPLLQCLMENSSNKLIKWKVIRAFSGCQMSKKFLVELKASENDPLLLQEITRSLKIIEQQPSRKN